MPIAKRSTSTTPTTGAEYAANVDTDTDDEAFEEESSFDRPVVAARKGWDAAEEVQKKVKTLGDFFQFSEEPALIAFVEGAPIDSYLVHWVDTKDGRRSFRCLDGEDDIECALCEIGDNPSAKFAFWVVEFTFKGDDINYDARIMEVGTKLKNTLKDMDADVRKGGPLEGSFYSAHRTGKKQTTQYHISRVKDRDLLEDWGLAAEDGKSAVKEMQEKGEPRLYIPNVEDVEAAALYMKRHG